MSVEVARWRQIGTNVDVLISAAPMAPARAAVAALIDEADAALSRFRDDSELSRVNRSAGRRVGVSVLLGTAISAALDAAQLTDGLVDPSVGRVVRSAGYDRDFGLLRGLEQHVPWTFESVPGWRAIEWNPATRVLRLPRGVELDLDSTGKALIVDMAVQAAAATLPVGGGVLVSIGGDMAVAGRPPRGGWRVTLAEDSSLPPEAGDTFVAIRSGALATSSTTVRRWRRNGRLMHHLIDPRTGRPAGGPWRTATVVAADCVAANAAAACAVISGPSAVDWLSASGLPARLVADDGSLAFVNGWPA